MNLKSHSAARSRARNSEIRSYAYIVLYVLALAVPAAMFLYIGAESLERRLYGLFLAPQSADAGEAGARAAELIETRSALLALEFLQDPALQDVPRLIQDKKNRVDPRRIEQLLKDVAAHHPFVRDVFLVSDGMVMLPRVRRLPAQQESRYVGRAESHPERVLRFLADGDRLLRAGQPTAAMQAYDRGYGGAESPQSQALFLLHEARCLKRLKLAEADDTYVKIRARYGEDYGPDGTPYALTAAFEQTGIANVELIGLQDELLGGRWDEVSWEQLQDLLRRFRQKLGNAGPAATNTSFLRRLEMARALQQDFSRRHDLFRTPIQAGEKDGKPHSGDTFAYSFQASSETMQAYFRYFRAGPASELMVGFVANLDWFQQKIVPEIVGDRFDLVFKGSAAPGTKTIAFPRMFPTWQLIPASAFTQHRTRSHDLFVLTGSAVLILLMLFGLGMLVRHIASERKIINMRRQFVSDVSHELKTPVSIIRLYSEMLLDQDSLDDEVREQCRMMCEEAQRLTHLIDGILDFAPIENDMKRYEMREGDLPAALMPTLLMYQSYLRRKDFNLMFDIARDLPTVMFDDEAVKSAVLNLLDNAVKYSASSRTVELRIAAQGRAVVIAVTDSGIGIKPTEQERIFEPYYRAQTGFSRGGCGLGLFLVKRIMEAHGGKVELKSTPRVGSCFRLVFPAQAQKPWDTIEEDRYCTETGR
jgi:signal transduction histidine kinase